MFTMIHAQVVSDVGCVRKNNEDMFDLDVELRNEFFSPNPSKQMPFIIGRISSLATANDVLLMPF